MGRKVLDIDVVILGVAVLGYIELFGPLKGTGRASCVLPLLRQRMASSCSPQLVVCLQELLCMLGAPAPCLSCGDLWSIALLFCSNIRAHSAGCSHQLCVLFRADPFRFCCATPSSPCCSGQQTVLRLCVVASNAAPSKLQAPPHDENFLWLLLGGLSVLGQL